MEHCSANNVSPSTSILGNDGDVDCHTVGSCNNDEKIDEKNHNSGGVKSLLQLNSMTSQEGGKKGDSINVCGAKINDELSQETSANGSRQQGIDDKTELANEFQQLKAAMSRECSSKRKNSIHAGKADISGVIQNSSSEPKQLEIPIAQMGDEDTQQSGANKRKADSFVPASKEGGTQWPVALPWSARTRRMNHGADAYQKEQRDSQDDSDDEELGALIYRSSLTAKSIAEKYTASSQYRH